MGNFLADWNTSWTRDMEDWETESKLGGRGWEGLPEAWVSFFSLWEHMGF